MIRIFVLLCLFAFHLQAAAPLTHLYLAKKYCDHLNIEGKDRKAFYKGSVFPDIRYLAGTSREETHREKISLDEILMEENFFEKGFLFHSFVDLEREKFIEKMGIYSFIETYSEEKKSSLLKLIEDEILYHQIDPRPFQIPFLEDLFDEELKKGFSLEIVEKWNQSISFYLSYSPSQFLKFLAFKKKEFFGIDAETCKTWSSLLPILRGNEDICFYFSLLIDHFEKNF